MRRLFLVLALVPLLGLPNVLAQTRTFDTFSDGLSDFIDGISTALPFNTNVGLGWSDAYIGQFPHLGFGVTVGATTLPWAAVTKATDALGISLAAQFPEMVTYGFPIPAASIDFRLGGFILPFDLGFKIGYLPPEVQELLPPQFGVEYLLIGGDVRFALVQEEGWLPDISIGGGYNYLNGSFVLRGLLGSNETISDLGGYDLTLTDPDLKFIWQASVIDLKVQISKQLLIITPYIGAGAAYGISSASAGLESRILVNGSPITAQQRQDIQNYFEIAGGTAPNLSNSGIRMSSDIQGWAFRVFGGLSLDLLILRIDLGAMYNFSSASYGVTGNVRFQF